MDEIQWLDYCEGFAARKRGEPWDARKTPEWRRGWNLGGIPGAPEPTVYGTWKK